MKFKIGLFFLLNLVLSPVCATKNALIVRNEYDNWVIYKKNEDELFIAKEFRGLNSPIYFGFIPKTGEILSPQSAEVLWDVLDIRYLKNYQS